MRKGKIKEDIEAVTEDTSTNAIQAFWSGTQAEYDAITTPDPNIIYFIE